jgi:hypothetical protein
LIVFARLAAAAAALVGQAGEHHHDHAAAAGNPATGSAHIVVTVNPEARVSAVRGRPLPLQQCGTPVAIEVAVVNQGFVTAPLRALLVGDGGVHARLGLEPRRLTGRSTESRLLRLEPIGRTPLDLTIAFSIS